jgi:hypothetical protein
MEMENESATLAGTVEDKRNGEIKAILYLLQSRLTEFLDEADKSYDLLDKIGEKTQLTKAIENALDNPLVGILKANSTINLQVVEIFKMAFSQGISAHKDIVDSAYFQKSGGREIRFFIVLKEDTEENRDALFSILSNYDETALQDLNPVFFHFIRPDLVGELENIEEIKVRS